MPADTPTDTNNDPRWTLVDPRPIREAHPYTFFVPSDAEKAALKEGDVVKLMFEGTQGEEPAVERMWVVFRGRNAQGCYGQLDNDPYALEGLCREDMIAFEDYHIVAVWDMKLDDVQDEEQFFARCHVDPAILADGREIAGLVRKKPKRFLWGQKAQQRFEDTGWHIYAAGGAQRPSRDMEYLAIGVVLNEDDGFVNYLDAPVGTRLVRDGDAFREA